MHVRMQKAMLPKFDEAEAMELASSDWTSDCEKTMSETSVEAWRHSEMTRHGYLSAVFEVADLWTCDIDAKLYAKFLWLLLFRITDIKAGHLMCVELLNDVVGNESVHMVEYRFRLVRGLLKV